MKNTYSIPTATAAALWRYDNLLCVKHLGFHDEYYYSIRGEEIPTPLCIKIWGEIKNRKTDYWKRGLKKRLDNSLLILIEI